MPATVESNKLLAWVMSGIAAVFIYGAYRNKSALDVILGRVGKPIHVPIDGDDDDNNGTVPAGDYDNPVRLRQLATREIDPILVNIQPNGKLDIAAANSKARIDGRLGYVVPNVGAYRSYAQQANLYASDPGRFAPPGKSLHVVGLAIDIHADYVSRLDVVHAYTSEGWHRARSDEPWHWSYGVRG